jgi:lysophospholipase L1-like esterase
VTELAVRLVLPRPGFYPFDRDETIGLKVPHPLLGFSYAANFSGRRTTRDYDHEITTNAFGLREGPINLQNAGEARFLAVGDSFTEGLGVEQADAWPARLEALIKSTGRRGNSIRVINAGIGAYSLKQIRMMAEELIPRLDPTLVMVGMFVEGFVRLEDPYVLLNGVTVRSSELGKLIPVSGGFLHSPFHERWAVAVDLWLDQHVYTGGHFTKALHKLIKRGGNTRPSGMAPVPISEATHHLSKTFEELALLKLLSEAHNVPVIVLLINRQNTDGAFAANAEAYNAAIKEYCREKGIPIVDPLPELMKASEGRPVFRFKRDSHWTARAHRIAAERMLDLLIDTELLSSHTRTTDSQTS